MRFLRGLVVALLSAQLVLPRVDAQQPVNRDAHATSLLEGTLARMGGRPATAASGEFTIAVSGTYLQFNQDPPTSYPFRVKVRALDQIRWESDRPEGTIVNVVFKDAAWAITPNGAQHIPISGIVGHQLEFFPLLAITKWLQSADVDIGPPSMEAVEGQRLHRIAIRPRRLERGTAEFQDAFEKMNQSELLLDANTLLPARFRYFAHPGDWRINIPMEMVFTDYQRAGAHLVPTRVTRYLRNQKLDEYRIESVQFNVQLEASDFALR